MAGSDFIKIENNFDTVTLEKSGKVLSFLHYWLRDQCMCEKCYNPTTFQRNIHILNVPDVKIREIQPIGDEIVILWEDGHTSKYKWSYLEQFSYDSWVQTKRREAYLWSGNNIENAVAHIDLEDFLTTNHGEVQVLESLVKYGVAFVENVEPTLEATEVICEKLGGVQHTLFGGMWSFTSDGARADTAYGNTELAPHNDNTYFTEAAGLQIFHILENLNATGGETTLVDGFLGAERLRNEYPEYFDFLRKHISEAWYLEDGYCYKNLDNVIKVNETTGQIQQIRYNVYDRSPMSFKTLEESRKYYAAYRKLSEYYNNESAIWKLKLKPGTVIAIDNFRVLHGRMGFSGKRIMGGAYVSRSGWQSKAATYNLI